MKVKFKYKTLFNRQPATIRKPSADSVFYRFQSPQNVTPVSGSIAATRASDSTR